ncbi:MAG: Gfo/Idh/MocA family oxidoreductase [Clostridiales bacterium]|nr:Gfo/Idh/MocA family oxidoreductase [Clostridiales bacterium]
MQNKKLTVSIIGVGGRGGEAYGRYINTLRDKFQLVSLCEINPVRLKKYGDMFEVKPENRFLSEDEFFKKKRSDVLIVSTQDRQHVAQAKRALLLGYNLLLEKPISDDVEELRSLLKTAQETGGKVMVCHVLRYTAMVRKIEEILKSGALGMLVSIDQTENVVYWHEAHSYVRGNWRKREESTPMIMAKCCHDLDLLQHFAGSKCKSVSSMGSLAYFKKAYQPVGAADRCLDCKFVDSCKYSAKRVYIEMWKNLGSPKNVVPMSIITNAYPLTEEAIYEAIKEGPYGRCAFACDNNVVDNQTTIMQFENGVTATLKMEAFVSRNGRDIRFFGTQGELEVREGEDLIVLRRYFETPKTWRISELTDDLEGHGGGDHRIIDALYEVMTEKNLSADTSLEKSIESHYMAIAAEESRLKGGELVQIENYR